MPNMIYKTFRVEVKAVNEETGEVDMLIPMSTASIDRDGDSINPLGWRKSLPAFKKRPILLSSHDYKDLRKQIGEFTQVKASADGLFAKPKYYINEGNEEADWAFKLASKGVAAYSVGFIPLKWTDGDFSEEDGKAVKPRRTYEEQELLEISHVVVPSNRDAIQSLRATNTNPVIKGLLDEVEREIVNKPEETENMYRIPVPGEAGKHTDHKIRTIDIDKGKGIKALYCVDDKKNITYMFDKDKWDSMEAARAWMMEHMPKSISQSEIRDELDYVDKLITQEGLSKETAFDAVDVAIRTMARAWAYHKWESITLGENLTGETEPVIFKRISGSDIPVEDKFTNQDILESIKRILNIGGK